MNIVPLVHLEERGAPTKRESRDELVARAIGVFLNSHGAWKQKPLTRGRVGDEPEVTLRIRGTRITSDVGSDGKSPLNFGRGERLN